jgi:membrane-bound lytic murein transglycosylase A
VGRASLKRSIHAVRIICCLAVVMGAEPATALPPLPAGAVAREVSYADLDGWADDDFASLWPALVTHCRALLAGGPSLRAAQPPPASLKRACASILGAAPTIAARRAVLEREFAPFHIVPATGAGFLTGYYEPEVPGALAPSSAFTAPLLARPDDLVTIAQGDSLPGIPAELSAARRTARGFEPYSTRAEIEAGALGSDARPIVWLRDAVEVFLMQVQGSGRVRLEDGSVMRIAYAGRNGLPYSSIGRVIVTEGHVALADLSLARLKSWLRENPAHAQRIMHMNRSYVFFRHASELSPDSGPIGGAGLPLTPFRSLAVDRGIWPYGIPIWLEVDLPPDPEAPSPPIPFRQLLVADDTGSAIVGPARGDLFHGSGEVAGRRAGALRHPSRFIVLWPRDRALP